MVDEKMRVGVVSWGWWGWWSRLLLGVVLGVGGVEELMDSVLEEPLM